MKPLSYITALLAASGVNATVTNVPKKDVKCSKISKYRRRSNSILLMYFARWCQPRLHA